MIKSFQLFLFLIFVFCSTAGQNKKPSEESKWEIRNPIFAADENNSFDEISVKDPSIVFFENKWHLFYTARSNTEYITAYVSAKNLDELNSANRNELKAIRGESRYGCAPQIFYFEPQQKWYLIFQNRNSNYQPAFSTNKNISKPKNWSIPKNLIEKDSPKKWIDFWVIADQQNVYLFYTENHSGVMIRSTSIKEFPKRWSDSKLVFDNVHEAVHIYKVKNKQEFHMIYELNKNGIRSFGLAIANQLEGPWEKNTDEYATANQLNFGKDVTNWTEMISHGEAIRSGYNQLLEYEPVNCSWIIQGIKKSDLNKPYEMLPWKLGIIKQTNTK